MVVRLRLSRWGAKHEPFYGIVAANARSPRDGKFLEKLGTYHAKPVNGVKALEINQERIKYWLGTGAQPTERVAWLLSKVDLLPPRPLQLQRQGILSLNDRSTWEAEEDGKRVPADNPPDIKLFHSDITKSNISLKVGKNKFPLKEKEALRLLKEVVY